MVALPSSPLDAPSHRLNASPERDADVTDVVRSAAAPKMARWPPSRRVLFAKRDALRTRQFRSNDSAVLKTLNVSYVRYESPSISVDACCSADAASERVPFPLPVFSGHPVTHAPCSTIRFGA